MKFSDMTKEQKLEFASSVRNAVQAIRDAGLRAELNICLKGQKTRLEAVAKGNPHYLD